jgi:hypothetical protein
LRKVRSQDGRELLELIDREMRQAPPTRPEPSRATRDNP